MGKVTHFRRKKRQGTKRSRSNSTGSDSSVAKKTTQATQTRPKKKSRKRYSSIPGKYVGKFRKAKRARKAGSFANATTAKYENGATYDVGVREVSYVGHSIAADRVAITTMRALLQHLFKAAEMPFYDWEQTCVSVLERQSGVPSEMFTNIEFRYRYLTQNIFTAAAINLQTQQIASGVSSNATFEDLANSLLNKWRDIDVGKEFINEFEFLDMSLSIKVDATSYTPIAYVPLQTCKIDMDIRSNLNVQNRTKAADGSSNTDNISVNPVRGKLYSSKKVWRNGFEMRPKQYLSGADNGGFASYSNVGIILNKSDASVNSLRKPPQAWQVNASHASGVVIQPGDIKRSKIKFATEMYLNTLVRKLWQYFLKQGGQGTPANKLVPFGYAEMIGVELMVDTRVSEALITMGWEMDQVYKAKVKFAKPRVLPYIEITN